MARLSRQRIYDYFDRGANAPTRTEQGRALEDLACYVVGTVPGIEIVKRNELNAFETEEIDVAFWNGKHPSGLHFLPYLFLVECKNWHNPVGSVEVSYFAQRLRHRGCDHGILFAANGITGTPSELTAAHYELAMALSSGQRIIVLTRSDLESVSTTAAVVRLVKERLCELTVSGTVFSQPRAPESDRRA